MEKLPRLKMKVKPDWNAPETLMVQKQTAKYYESMKAIGRYYRRVKRSYYIVDIFMGLGCSAGLSSRRWSQCKRPSVASAAL
jgi:hypothetical protein